MNRTFCLILLLPALCLTSVASEEEFVPWQTVTVTSPEHPVVGTVTIEASMQGDAFQKLAVGAFGRTHILAAAELKRLDGFPLSSLTLKYEASYAPLGGSTFHLKFKRSYYDQAKKLTQTTIIVSIPKDAVVTILEQGPR